MMSDDIEGLDLAIAERFGKRKTATAAGRREKETRVIPYSDRRKARATGRTEQLNVKCRPEWKKRLVALAEHEGKLIVEVIEEAVEAYEKQRGWGAE